MSRTGSESSSALIAWKKQVPTIFLRDCCLLPLQSFQRIPVPSSFIKSCELFTVGTAELKQYFRGSKNGISSGNCETNRIYCNVSMTVDPLSADEEYSFVGCLSEIVKVERLYDFAEMFECLRDENGRTRVLASYRDVLDFEAYNATFVERDEDGRMFCNLISIVCTDVKSRGSLSDRTKDSIFGKEHKIEEFNMIFEHARRIIRISTGEGLEIDLFVDQNVGGLNTTMRYMNGKRLKKLNPFYKLGEITELTRLDLMFLEQAKENEAFKLRCGGEVSSIYDLIANSPIPYNRVQLGVEAEFGPENFQPYQYCDPSIKHEILKTRDALSACYVGAQDTHELRAINKEKQKWSQDYIEQVAEGQSRNSIAHRIMESGKAEFSKLVCRECGQCFGNAKKAIRPINPFSRSGREYGRGSAKCFVNPTMLESEILTCDPRWIYNVEKVEYYFGADKNCAIKLTIHGNKPESICSFFEHYGWQNVSCAMCDEHLGWIFERMLPQINRTPLVNPKLVNEDLSGVDNSYNNLPELLPELIFFGFLRSKVGEEPASKTPVFSAIKSVFGKSVISDDKQMRKMENIDWTDAWNFLGQYNHIPRRDNRLSHAENNGGCNYRTFHADDLRRLRRRSRRNPNSTARGFYEEFVAQRGLNPWPSDSSSETNNDESEEVDAEEDAEEEEEEENERRERARRSTHSTTSQPRARSSAASRGPTAYLAPDEQAVLNSIRLQNRRRDRAIEDARRDLELSMENDEGEDCD